MTTTTTQSGAPVVAGGSSLPAPGARPGPAGGEALLPQLAELGLAPELAARGVADEAVAAIRAETEAARLVEHRTVTLTGLIERFATRYLERATLELTTAIEGLRAAGEVRALCVGRICTSFGLRYDATLAELIDAAPEPFSSTLSRLRRELNATKRRISLHADRNTELLGRRMALIAEAICGYPDGLPPTYGRPEPVQPRLVRGVL
ncbi:MAG TPA: hypothetical protein VMD59_08965 [Acidimicrobiales bacterium]|nr:hypothetical protein [Acidimicrobiales bacterium]